MRTDSWQSVNLSALSSVVVSCQILREGDVVMTRVEKECFVGNRRVVRQVAGRDGGFGGAPDGSEEVEGMDGERRARPRPRRGVRRRGEGGLHGGTRVRPRSRRVPIRARVRSSTLSLAPTRARTSVRAGGPWWTTASSARAHGRVTSVAVMCLVVALVFWILGDTAERYFCPVVRTLADRWNLAPATAGVTLLALGNGAPDVFASLAAFTRGTTSWTTRRGTTPPPPPAPPRRRARS